MLLVFFVASVHTLLMGALAPRLDHRCAKPPDSLLSDEQWLRRGIPCDENGEPSRCMMYLPNGTQSRCSSWNFKSDVDHKTLREEV